MSNKLDNFVNKEIENSILKYPILFKDFLEMDDEIYDTLKKAESLVAFIIGALLAGGGYVLLSYLGMGTLTTILVVLGITSPFSIPTLIAAIIGGGAIAIAINKISDNHKKKFFKILPKYINSSIDFLAQLIAQFLYAKCKDKNKVIKFLVEKMGYNEQFLNSYEFKNVDNLSKYQNSLKKMFEKNNIDFNKFLEKTNTLC